MVAECASADASLLFVNEETCLDFMLEIRGFARHSPLAFSGGKARICRKLRLTHSALVMVGDGKTDLEAKLAGAYMIGFGGVLKRQIVQEQADCYITDPSLTAILPYVLCS